MTIRLSNATLGDLPDTVTRPIYDRSALTPGIVHIGLGNFHRAHQAWYLNQLLQMGVNRDWAIIGAGIRPYDEQMRLKLQQQDYLTTLIELDPAGSSAEVIGSMINYIRVEEGNGPLIQQMAAPEIRIVAMTVTEGGYYINAATKGFDDKHPDIQHDAQHPESPRTAFGAMIAALKLRREHGHGPFTCMSCDNLQGNGRTLRQTIVSLARMSDPALADWIDANCTFPNAMVDCIVPATGAKELALARSFGIDDSVPVTHESFRQWVIEDQFCAGRPDWEKADVTFSDNVHGYEAQKIRILNAGHQVIANVAEVLHIETISESLGNESVRALLRKVEMEEIVPHVVPVPGMTPKQYFDLIEKRFSNPKIVDTTRRVAFDGSSRHPGFILPTIRDGLKAGTSIQGLAFVEAAWARMCEGTREDNSLIEPNDPLWSDLTKQAKAAKTRPLTWLEMRNIYADLANDTRFADAFEHWLNRIYNADLDGKVAAITGGASGIGLASARAMLEAGASVVIVDSNQQALEKLQEQHGEQLIPLVLDLLDPPGCASLMPRILEKTGKLDIFHANAGLYVGGDLIAASNDAIDRMLHLNINVVMKNVHDVLPHMIERGSGDIIVTSSLAAHFPTPWEPEAKQSGSLIEADEVANVVMFMLTRPRGMTIRDVVMMPSNFDL
ncbi:unnamed protein product [Cyprideis torosa]|uniref:mannitol 2-dehydrogenase n=1 Tax=Cyprideis torosa TaxID=163714 RepID=A0A7R8ZJ19_9CRUS|nr:unnamed protein product [Cyprideis torosa]CAG0878817.1 unnamed protein product [Cyprideis torosa]